MRSIVLSLLLLVSGLFAGAAAHAQTPFPPPVAYDGIASAAAPADHPAPVLLRHCLPLPALQAAAPGPDTSLQTADACGGSSQITLDDRNEMIWLDHAPAALALAYLSPRNAVAPHGLSAAWQRTPLRPPRAG